MKTEMVIKIRQEQQEDYLQIRNLVRDAFAFAEHADGDEHNLIERLRLSSEYIPELSVKYRNIIFDFDGTLADTSASILETMHRTIDALKLPEKTDEECRSIIGYRLEETPSILWPDIQGIAERYVTTYREIFNSVKDSFKIQLFPHVLETLDSLNRQGIRMAIASSRNKVSLQECCSDLHIYKYFQMLVGAADVKNGKPAPDPVNLILDSQGWDKNETLVVGDMGVDILMGKGAGAAACGVTYGNGSVAELQEAGADHIISDFSELIGI